MVDPRRQELGVVARRGTSGDDKRATAVVTRHGCRRGEFFEGYEAASRGMSAWSRAVFGRELASRVRKRGEPLAGSGVQQTRDRRMEQAVRAVRNRGDGTSPGAWQRQAEGSRRRLPGVDIRTARRRGGTSGRISREEGHRPSAEREL